MRPRVLGLALTAALPILSLLVATSPASATTTCRDVDNGNTTITRACEVNSSRIGGLVKGAIYWDYKHGPFGQYGDVVLDEVKDRTADGKCTRVKVKYRDPNSANPNPPETVVRTFCHGRKGQVVLRLNRGSSPSGPDGDGPFPVYKRGFYSVEHCSGWKAKTCVVLWRQRVARGEGPHLSRFGHVR